jgi:hypothetical protein
MTQTDFDPWLINIFFGFFFSVLLGIVGTHLFRIIKNMLGVYQLNIDSDGVELALIRSGNKLTSNMIPLPDVKSVMFDSQGEVDATTLHILNTAQFEMVQKEIHGDLSIKDPPRLLKTHLTHNVVLRIDGIDLIDQVHLEQLVEAAVRRAGGEVV